MIGGSGNMFVSVQCSDSQSDAEFKQTRVNRGSIYDSLKVTSSECESNGNLKQAWVNGGRCHDSLKVASALNFQSDGNSNKRCSIWAVAQRRPGGGLLFWFLGYGSKSFWSPIPSASRRGRCCSTQASLVTVVEGPSGMAHLCREYSLPRDDPRIRARGWIRRNTKNGPVLNTHVCNHEDRDSVEIQVRFLFQDRTASWVRIVNGIERYVHETTETMEDEEHGASGKLIAKARPRVRNLLLKQDLEWNQQ